jgi:sugar-specific transcriptional regulator TrmB
MHVHGLNRKYCASENELEILVKLGLSKPQAEIYCAIARMQEGTNAEISRIASMARQQVYREMPRLLQLGLVEKIITTPTKYSATPINVCIDILNKRKMSEFIELQKETKHFLKIQNTKPLLSLEEPSQFVLTGEKNIIFRRYIDERRKAKKSIEYIGSAYRNERALIDLYGEFKKTQKQGVKIRIITQRLRKTKKIQDIISSLMQGSFEIREVLDEPPVTLAIHDGKIVSIVVPNPELPKAEMPPELWSNNASIVTLAAKYFETMWNKAEAVNIPQFYSSQNTNEKPND